MPKRQDLHPLNLPTAACRGPSTAGEAAEKREATAHWFTEQLTPNAEGTEIPPWSSPAAQNLSSETCPGDMGRRWL
jgi:hypothetical protein